MTPSIELHHGDCLEVLKTLPTASVQTCVTSPPYFGLRDYGCDGQIGLEPTPDEFVAALVAVFREVRRVLRDDGTVWLNLGDSYANDGKWGGTTGGKHAGGLHGEAVGRGKRSTGLKPKDLIGIPWMVAFALRADGWYLRSDIIWAKPNPMPESVTDRPTKSHEYIFLLSKSAKYHYDHEAIKEPLTSSSIKRLSQPNFDNQTGGPKDYGNGTNTNRSARRALVNLKVRAMCPQVGTSPGQFAALTGRNKRSVWTIPTKPFSAAKLGITNSDHFACFPPDLIRPCVLAGTSATGCCPACGTPWKRVTRKQGVVAHDGKTATAYEKGSTSNRLALLRQAARARGEEYTNRVETTGWESACDCPPAAPVPCVVLDPFAGSATTGEVCIEEGRNFIGIELSAEYLDIAKARIAAAQLSVTKELDFGPDALV